MNLTGQVWSHTLPFRCIAGVPLERYILTMVSQQLLPITLLSLSIALSTIPSHAASTKIVVAEGQYVMADGDTLGAAEEKVLQRAQRRAVEEAGIYLESTFHDVEKESGGRTSQTSSLEIRTIAAAITQTEILESGRTFDNDRPVFFVRIRATVNLDSLADAIKRLKSDEQLARHFRQLQQENYELRAQLQELARWAGRIASFGSAHW